MSARHRAAIAAVLSLEGDGDECIPADLEEQSLDATDTLFRNTEQVHATADILRTANAAADCCDAVTETAAEGTALGEIKKLVESVNSNEQWTPALFQMLSLQLEGIAQRLELPKAIGLGVTLSDIKFHSGAVNVSTEGMDQVISALNGSGMDLEERSVSALLDLVSALCDSVPLAYQRLCELNGRAEHAASRDKLAPVQLDASVRQRLTVTDRLPSPFSGFVNEYCQYGKNLLTEYTETAFQSVMQSTTFQQGISQASTVGFWDSISDKVRSIRDPRSHLTEGQMSMVLPGAGALFGAKTADRTSETMRDTLHCFVHNYAPARLGTFTRVEESSASSDESVEGVPALHAGEIRDCIAYLNGLHDVINLKAMAESCKAGWMDSYRTIRMVKEGLQTSRDNLPSALEGDDRLVAGYLETLFTLSSWPVLNYLTNLVLTIHAFVDYAAASLEAEDAPVEPAAPVSDEVDIADQPEPEQEGVVDVGTKGDEEGAELEDGKKPENPGEVPDTGADPDNPEDATGNGERAVVTGVDETLTKNAEEAEQEETPDPAAEGSEEGEGTETGTPDTEGSEETPPEEESEESKEEDSEEP